MSESEQMGRCFNEVDECRGSPSELKIADAIDRLAADVASIKAKVDAVSPEDVAHLVESEKAFAELFAQQRDAAIRERNEARALLELAQVQRTAAYADRDEARAEVYRLKCSMTETIKERDAAIRERDQWREEARLAVINRDEARAEVEKLKESRDAERDGARIARSAIEKLKKSCDAANRLYGAEQAKVERLRKELEQRQPAGNSPKTPDSSTAAPQPAAVCPDCNGEGQHDSGGTDESGKWLNVPCETCRCTGAAPGAPQPAAPAAGWLTDEEREVLSALKDMADSHLGSPRVSLVVKAILARAAPQPAAPPAGWLTERERGALSRAFDLLCDDDGDNPLAGTVQALLARAGSPPVVEVPAMPLEVGDANTHTGQYLRGRRDIAVSYRAALDKAGVEWREVPRG